MTSIVEMVRHYQRSIEKSMENPTRLLHCIEKLNKLPISVEHLQETGVGRTVNNLRKYDGEVGYASKALVSKWKTMVATEEAENDSQEENTGADEMQQEELHEDEQDEDEQDDMEENLHIDETENIEPAFESSDDYQDQQHTLHSNNESVKSHNNENHHKKSSKHSSDRKNKSDKKHSHKDRDGHASTGTKEKESSRKDKESSSNKEHKRHKEDHESQSRKEDRKSKSSETKSLSTSNTNKHHSSSKKETEKSNSSHKSDSHSSKSNKKSSKSDADTSPKENGSHDETRDDERRKKHEKKESRSHDSKKSSRKDKDKDDSGKKRKRETSEIIIDSTMGASFADALGMLDMPSSSKSNKKHLNERPSTSAAQPSISPSNQVASTSTSSTKKSSSSISSSNTNNSSTTKKLMEEPELLTKRPKLEPLPDIVSEIAPPAPTFTISNNYKPMPLNQTVMDCLFNQTSKPIRQMTDEEALTYSISSNKSRTKVFSGAKTGIKGKVETLFELCIRILQDHIDYLEYTGGVPFDILRPVLERATPEQLMTLEDYNPYLIEDSDCLWEQHCKRRFRGKRPEELESWREMFLRCLDEEQAKFSRLTENIKLARDKKLPVRKTKLAYVDSVVKPPRSIKSKQMKYGTDTLPNVTPAARVESLKNVGGNTASIGDRRLKIAAELRNSIPTHGPRINPNKKAPLMAKTLISMKKVFKR